jgi:transcriptional regulator with XRE-family HTH domain
MEELANNIRRILGLHALRATRDSYLLELSPQALSELQTGTRRPSLETITKIATFFEVPIERLMSAGFDDLLANELSDPERFQRVEAKKETAPTRTRRRARRT